MLKAPILQKFPLQGLTSFGADLTPVLLAMLTQVEMESIRVIPKFPFFDFMSIYLAALETDINACHQCKKREV